MYPKDTFVLSFVFRLSDGRCTDGPQVQIRDQPIGKREAVTRFGRAALPEVSRGSRPEPGRYGRDHHLPTHRQYGSQTESVTLGLPCCNDDALCPERLRDALRALGGGLREVID